MPDHVHILAKIKPSMAPAEMVKRVKGNSSKWLNERPDCPGRFEWQAGYGIFSVSSSLVETVRRYIRRQEEHHRKMSFEEELITLLERNGIPYDERYLLG